MCSASVLAPQAWNELRKQHEARIDGWVVPWLRRRGSGLKHPVEDFLFDYYSQSPAQLRRWHPGTGIRLAGAGREGFLGRRGYRDFGDTVGIDPEFVRRQAPLVRAIRSLLAATAQRPPAFGCLGLHEWAMVYRQAPPDRRHPGWPLRLGMSGTDRVVQTHRIRCTHFDAYRFFTKQAEPLNLLRPNADDRERFEQPGCLHAGMDLYKHAFRLSPMVGSDLVADCFGLARDIREVDMRASPYDLTGLGYEPIQIETPEGKLSYTTAQRRLSERAAPLRRQLIAVCESLLTGTPDRNRREGERDVGDGEA
jgi:hypothetical protein